MEFQPCQSNYSLTLGFAHNIDYWDGDNTSEDMHTTMKAMAFNNAALNSVFGDDDDDTGRCCWVPRGRRWP